MKQTIGLRPDAKGYAIYEVFGNSGTFVVTMLLSQ